jgi:hypothetical protein
MNSTVYPGKRISTGGKTPSYDFYSFLTNLGLPYNSVKVSTSNACELSSFYNFLPAILLALPVLIFKRRKSLKYGIALAIFSSFFALYTMFSYMPAIVVKFTLLSYVTGTRAMLAYAFSAALLSIWALSELSRSGGMSRVYSIIVSVLVTATYIITVIFTSLNGSSKVIYFVIIIAVLGVLNYLLLRGKRWAFSALMVCLIVASGIGVNPINLGAGGVLSSKISKEIQEVDKADSASLWLGVSEQKEISGAIGVLIYANGAKSLGGINNYPDNAKWSEIDPMQKYDSVYNRSAHISYQIVTTDTKFVLTGANAFQVNVNVDDLEKLNVSYIVSNQELTDFNDDDVNFQSLYDPDDMNYTIYQVNYSK